MPEQSSRQTKVEAILQKMVDAGAFEFAIVASREGLPLAMVGNPDSDVVAAVVAPMKDLAERAQTGVTEITTRNATGSVIVNRFFTLGEDFLLLSVQVPKGKAYRRLMNKAIRRIKQVWST